MLEIREYLDRRGRSPFARWFAALDARTAARVSAVLARMEAGNLGDTKSVGAGVLERRVHSGPGYRIYFGREGRRVIVLLAGGTKRAQRRDIEHARARWQDYLDRRQEAGSWR